MSRKARKERRLSKLALSKKETLGTLIILLLLGFPLFTLLIFGKQRKEITALKPPLKESPKEERKEATVFLTDLRGSNYTATLGTSLSRFSGKKRYHLETQNLKPLQPGQSYEVWLRAESGVMMSLGNLEVRENGQSFMEFSLDEGILNFYKSVIVSFKKDEKEIPGTLIMEGDLVKK